MAREIGCGNAELLVDLQDLLGHRAALTHEACTGTNREDAARGATANSVRFRSAWLVRRPPWLQAVPSTGLRDGARSFDEAVADADDSFDLRGGGSKLGTQPADMHVH